MTIFWRRGFTLIELLVTIAIIGVLIALLLPAVQAAREVARRAQCASMIGQLAFALRDYHSAHRVLPPGCVNPTGPIKSTLVGYHVSWTVQVLPYIAQQAVYDAFNFGQDAYADANMTVLSVFIGCFNCPSDPGRGGTSYAKHTNYAGCHHHVEAPIDVTNRGLLYLNSSISTDDIPDGDRYTILLGEIPRTMGLLGWISGSRSTLRNTGLPLNSHRDRLPRDPIEADNLLWVGGFGSLHPAGGNFAFADGSVEFISESIDRQVYQSLGARDDGGIVNF